MVAPNVEWGSVAVERLEFLVCIRKLTGSKLGTENGYTESCITGFIIALTHILG
jgi:hypothetical protein